MNKYKKVAIKAARIAKDGSCPRAVWDKVAACKFKDRTASIKKGCPKNAFLGLAEDGFIKGVPSGSYTKSVLNKQYALKALALIKQDPSLENDLKKLWTQSCGSESKRHNSQMDVVIALWSEGLLK